MKHCRKHPEHRMGNIGSGGWLLVAVSRVTFSLPLSLDMFEACPICTRAVPPFSWSAKRARSTDISCEVCGRFRCTEQFTLDINAEPLENPHHYSGAIRELNDRGVESPILSDRESFLSQVVIPRNPLEMMDRFLICLKNRTVN